MNNDSYNYSKWCKSSNTVEKSVSHSNNTFGCSRISGLYKSIILTRKVMKSPNTVYTRNIKMYSPTFPFPCLRIQVSLNVCGHLCSLLVSYFLLLLRRKKYVGWKWDFNHESMMCTTMPGMNCRLVFHLRIVKYAINKMNCLWIHLYLRTLVIIFVFEIHPSC